MRPIFFIPTANTQSNIDHSTVKLQISGKKNIDFHLNRLVFSRNWLRLQHRSSSDRHRSDGLLFVNIIRLLEKRRENLVKQRTNALAERRALRSRQFSCNKYKF